MSVDCPGLWDCVTIKLSCHMMNYCCSRYQQCHNSQLISSWFLWSPLGNPLTELSRVYYILRIMLMFRNYNSEIHCLHKFWSTGLSCSAIWCMTSTREWINLVNFHIYVIMTNHWMLENNLWHIRHTRSTSVNFWLYDTLYTHIHYPYILSSDSHITIYHTCWPFDRLSIVNTWSLLTSPPGPQRIL